MSITAPSAAASHNMVLVGDGASVLGLALSDALGDPLEVEVPVELIDPVGMGDVELVVVATEQPVSNNAARITGSARITQNPRLPRPYGHLVGSASYDRFWGSIIKVTQYAHTAVYRLSGGRLWRRFPGGAQVVWITTKGRKSGEWRTAPLLAAPVDRDWAIAGSNAGTERVPSWVYNLADDDQGFIEIDGVKYAATFREVHGAERAELYAALQRGWKFYKNYEQHAKRTIPVYRVVLNATD